MSEVVSGVLTVTVPLTNVYQAPTNTVMVQRIPHYNQVRVENGGRLTAHAWDGQTGGVLFFRAVTLTVGVTGTLGANILAREADLVIGVGTRYSDFTSASKTAFQNPNVRFININVAAFDAYKHHAIPLVGEYRNPFDPDEVDVRLEVTARVEDLADQRPGAPSGRPG